MMIDSSFPLAARKFSRQWRHIAALFFWCSAALAAAQTDLPKAAVSIPQNGGESLAASLQAASPCVRDVPVVLPAVRFSLAADADFSRSFADQAAALASLSADAQAWLHVAVPADAFTGKETEKQITEQVDSFLRQAPLGTLAVRGVVFEPNASSPVSDTYLFALLRLAVAVKSVNPAARVAFVFPTGFIDANGEAVKRLALYADLLGTQDSPQWRADAAWIANNALNKPLMLKLEESGAAAYLRAVLAASGSTVQMIWPASPDQKEAGQLCVAAGTLAHQLPSGLLRVNAKALSFSMSIDGAASDQAIWLSNSESGDMAMIAPVGGTADHPKTVTLHGAVKTQYELHWLDPESGAGIAAPEPVNNEAGLTATCNCQVRFALVTLHKKTNSEKSVFNQVEVKGGVDLSVEEIIARWQQYREAQKQRLENYQACSFMNLHFESTNVAQAFDISMRMQAVLRARRQDGVRADRVLRQRREVQQQARVSPAATGAGKGSDPAAGADPERALHLQASGNRTDRGRAVLRGGRGAEDARTRISIAARSGSTASASAKCGKR